ncbi:MAG TPA: glycosyltransferase family 2 protein [Chloroflexota bacterium]|nr:glycosyltransferase family 2 protein [Chloroflexota bacterium]
MTGAGITHDVPVAREQTATVHAGPSGPPDVSVVVPVFEEAESVPRLHRQLADMLGELDRSAEIVFVDDGSRDETPFRLQEAFESDGRVRVVRLRRNFGKTAALLAGFRVARGNIVVTLDGDLQDDPKEIPRFLAAIDQGFDLVSGWKRVRHDPLTKTVPSRLFNLTVRQSTGIPLHDFNCGFKAYRREVLDELKLYGELHRFIPVMAYWRGFRVGELEVAHRSREFGRSKFGAGRLLKGLLDFVKVMFLTRYLQRPLQLFGFLGIGLLGLGTAGFLYLLVLKLMGQSVFQSHGPLLVVSGIAIISGLQLFMLGLVGEMLRHYSFRPEDEYSVTTVLDHGAPGPVASP